MPKNSRTRERKSRNVSRQIENPLFTGDSCNMRASSTRSSKEPTLYCGKPFAGEWKGSLEATAKTPVRCGLTQLDYLSPQTSGLFERIPPPPDTRTLMDRLTVA